MVCNRLAFRGVGFLFVPKEALFHSRYAKKRGVQSEELDSIPGTYHSQQDEILCTFKNDPKRTQSRSDRETNANIGKLYKRSASCTM